MKNNKSSGLDNIPTLIWKDHHFHHSLLHICNQTFTKHIPPSPWLTSGIVPIPKKGDLTDPSNYRGISLIPIATKIYNKLILNRLVPVIDPLLRKNQNGFRRGRSKLSQILSLRRIVEEMRNCNKEVTFCFVDFKKAFDSINREAMFEILLLYGIPNKIVQAIKSVYTNTKALVISPDGETDYFEILAGVLQGDTLAPFLFVLVLDYVLRISIDKMNEKGLQIRPRNGRRHPAQHLTDLGYADDLALISSLVNDAQSLLHSLEYAASLVGLYCNESKTEYVNTSKQDTSMQTQSGKFIKKVDDFKYLGSYIMDSGKDFKTRKALAWSACNNLDKIWRSNINTNIKVDVFKTTVEPILLYGAETWTLNSNQQKRLDGTYTNLLRRIKNINWRQHPTKKQIYGNIPPLSTRRRTQFAGHCYRATGEIISSLLLWQPLSSKRSRKLTYPDIISRDTGIEVKELGVAMLDRGVWKEVVGGISAEAEG